MHIKGIPTDRSLDLHIRVDTDSSATEDIPTRRRLGKVKHLETRTLSVQDKVDVGVELINANMADLGTEILSGCEIRHLVSRLSLEFDQAGDSFSTETGKKGQDCEPVSSVVRSRVWSKSSWCVRVARGKVGASAFKKNSVDCLIILKH